MGARWSRWKGGRTSPGLRLRAARVCPSTVVKGDRTEAGTTAGGGASRRGDTPGGDDSSPGSLVRLAPVPSVRSPQQRDGCFLSATDPSANAAEREERDLISQQYATLLEVRQKVTFVMTSPRHSPALSPRRRSAVSARVSGTQSARRQHGSVGRLPARALWNYLSNGKYFRFFLRRLLRRS